ncbi:MAG TPA: DUF1109 domain-containing protein [Burkholderiaceae bacterium]|nr:DUF1109 domain-containing protein [Burkholderiaceae bacterium]
MKTDDLVTMLATGVEAVDPRVAARRLALALAVGAAAGSALLLALLGPNPELARYLATPMHWVKVGFTAALAAGGLWTVARLARPGRRLAGAAFALAVPVLVIWLMGGASLANAAPAQRATLLFGNTWTACPLNIALLALPSFVAFLWALRDLAPTRLRLAGATAGFAAGALGALIYTIHCPELAAPFLGVWYVLGMLVPAAVGAAIGPRVLRW